MKSTVLTSAILMLVISVLQVNAQEKPKNEMERYNGNPSTTPSGKVYIANDTHEHRGVYLSFALGPCFGNVHEDLKTTSDKIIYSGTGVAFDFRIGGPVDENLILTFDMLTRSVSSPKVEMNGTTYSSSSDITMAENTYGAGLTYYVMPQNFYLGATLGMGNYSVQNSNDKSNTRSDYGFSGALRVGKQWWLSRKWALGIGLIGSYTSLTNKDSGMEEKLSGPRLSMVAHISMN